MILSLVSSESALKIVARSFITKPLSINRAPEALLRGNDIPSPLAGEAWVKVAHGNIIPSALEERVIVAISPLPSMQRVIVAIFPLPLRKRVIVAIFPLPSRERARVRGSIH